jgi:aldehyde:ferredoxin oxidoreductase
LELEGPEYETIYAIGGLNAIDSLEEVAWLNDLCDRLGLDTMSGGNISAFAIEAYKAGKIDFAIDYNQPDRVAELFELIANREGIGALFARGIVAVAAELGLDDLAVHVKGLEPAGFDPRVLKGMGLSYATAARGACHLRATFYKAELSGEFDRDKIAGKAFAMIDYEDRATLFDSLILCRFFRDFVMWDELEILIEATTGVCYDKEALQKIAGKTANLAREFNRREGLDETYDKLPKRFFEKNEEGAVLSKEEMAIMLGEYNKLRKAAA